MPLPFPPVLCQPLQESHLLSIVQQCLYCLVFLLKVPYQLANQLSVPLIGQRQHTCTRY